MVKEDLLSIITSLSSLVGEDDLIDFDFTQEEEGDNVELEDGTKMKLANGVIITRLTIITDTKY